MELIKSLSASKIVFIKLKNKLYKIKVLNKSTIYLFNTNQIISTNPESNFSFIKKLGKESIHKIYSPICGKITNVNVSTNQKVKSGTNLVTIESMKMENDILASFDLFIKNIHIKQEDLIKEGEVLIEIEKI